MWTHECFRHNENGIYMNNEIGRKKNSAWNVFKCNEAFMFPLSMNYSAIVWFPFNWHMSSIYSYKHARSSTMTFWQGVVLLMTMVEREREKLHRNLLNCWWGFSPPFSLANSGKNVLRNWFSKKNYAHYIQNIIFSIEM